MSAECCIWFFVYSKIGQSASVAIMSLQITYFFSVADPCLTEKSLSRDSIQNGKDLHLLSIKVATKIVYSKSVESQSFQC